MNIKKLNTICKKNNLRVNKFGVLFSDTLQRSNINKIASGRFVKLIEKNNNA